MLDFVHGVHRDPTERALEESGVVVHQRAFPIAGAEAGEIVGEEVRGVGQLAGNGRRILLGLAVVLDAFVATHRID